MQGYSDRVPLHDGMQLYTRQLLDLLNHLVKPIRFKPVTLTIYHNPVTKDLTLEHNQRVVLLGLSFGGR